VMDALRGRLLTRVAGFVDVILGHRIVATLAEAPLRRGAGGEATLPLRDLDTVRTFVAGSGALAIFDLPWIPFYLAICWAFHPLIGLTAFCGAIALTIIAAISEVMSRKPARRVARTASRRMQRALEIHRHAEVIRALGMEPSLMRRWERASAAHRNVQVEATDLTLNLAAASKIVRMGLQSGVLAVGAWLVIEQQATGGIIIAGSILSARALAPADAMIANWKAFATVRQCWRQLAATLETDEPRDDGTIGLPPPVSRLDVCNLSGHAPGSSRLIVKDVTFVLRSGETLGLIGPSGSGKSSLVRLLVGAWRPHHGTIRLDGATLDQWPLGRLGEHIGYVPQSVELLPGTIAENIARFDPRFSSGDVIEAAMAAGCHALVLAQPNGYHTLVGDGGTALSGGQRQWIALARALCGKPFLVVLDEPNSNLDQEGEAALAQAILGVRERGGIVVVVAQRPSVLASVDLVGAMAEGRLVGFGPKDQFLGDARKRMARMQEARGGGMPRPMAVVPPGGRPT
jgi:PrtD family type I secretion system ABC transporter